MQKAEQMLIFEDFVDNLEVLMLENSLDYAAKVQRDKKREDRETADALAIQRGKTADKNNLPNNAVELQLADERINRIKVLNDRDEAKSDIDTARACLMNKEDKIRDISNNRKVPAVPGAGINNLAASYSINNGSPSLNEDINQKQLYDPGKKLSKENMVTKPANAAQIIPKEMKEQRAASNYDHITIRFFVGEDGQVLHYILDPEFSISDNLKNIADTMMSDATCREVISAIKKILKNPVPKDADIRSLKNRFKQLFYQIKTSNNTL